MAAGTNASSSESRVSPPTADLDSLKRPDKLSSDLSRKKRRQEQNRVSARESRRKRKEYLLYIENRVKELEEENKKLHEIIDNNLPKTFGMARCHCSIL